MTGIAKLYRKNYNNLTKAEKQIAEYICGNPKKVIMMTSLDLGKKLNVSDATVLRFSKKIGFSKYNELKEYLAEELEARKSVIDKMLDNWNNDREDNNSVKKMINADIKNMQKLYMDLDLEEIDNVVKLMQTSKKIFVIGVGSSRAVAEMLGWHCMVLGLEAVTISEGGYGLFEKIAHVTKDDCVIFFSVPKYLKDEVQMMELLHTKKVPSVVITNNLFSKIASYASIFIPVETDNTSFFNSFILHAEVCNVILLKLFEGDRNRYFQYFKQNEKDQSFLYEDEEPSSTY